MSISEPILPPETPASSPAAEAAAQPRGNPAAAKSQLARFFILPAIIVGVCAFCLLLAGGLYVLLKESGDPATYVEQVASGSGNKRWQAAYELSKVIAANEGNVDDSTAAALFALYEKTTDPAIERATGEDPRVRQYLTLTVGRIKRPESVPALRKVLGDSDVDTRIYAIWGLGMQGDAASAPEIAKLLADDDSGVRKMASYSLGFLHDTSTAPDLAHALTDGTVDVRWNAALALAQMNDGRAAPVLLSMVDRAALEAMTDPEGNRILDGERIRKTMMAGIQGLTLLRHANAEGFDPVAVDATIKKLSESEPDLTVRNAAIQSLSNIEG